MQRSTSQTRPLIWALIAVLNLALIVHLLIYIVGASPEFTPAAQLKLWLSAAAALGLGGFALWRGNSRTPLTLPTSAHTVFVIGAASFVFGLSLLPVPPYVSPNFAHAHALLTFLVSLLAIYHALFDGEQPVRRARWWLIAAGVLGVIVTLVRIRGLAVYPFVDLQDEAWVTAWAVNWLKTGRFGDPTLFGLGDAYYAYPRFYWFVGDWIRLFGIGIWQERLFGFLLITPVIGFTTAAARSLYGTRVAVLTAVTLFASAVLMSAARVRHDIGLALCVAVSLWLYTEAVRRKSLLLHCAAGVIIAFGMFSHYHAVGFGLALLIGLYLPGYIQRRRLIPDGGMIAFGVGGLLGFAVVMLVQILPDDLNGWIYILTHISKYSDDFNQFVIALFGNVLNIGFFSIFELLLLSLGVIAALRRRRQRDVMLLLILVITHVLLAIMASGAIYYYILPLTPIYGILIGALFVRRDETRSDLLFKRGDLVTFTLLLLPLLGATTVRPLQALLNGEPIQTPTPPAVQWVLDHVPHDQAVGGDVYYYFWLSDYPFASHLIYEYLYPDNYVRYPTIDAVWEAAAPDILIIDPAYVRSYDEYFTPLMETGWIAEHYTVLMDFDDSLSTAIIYQRNE